MFRKENCGRLTMTRPKLPSICTIANKMACTNGQQGNALDTLFILPLLMSSSNRYRHGCQRPDAAVLQPSEAHIDCPQNQLAGQRRL